MFLTLRLVSFTQYLPVGVNLSLLQEIWQHHTILISVWTFQLFYCFTLCKAGGSSLLAPHQDFLAESKDWQKVWRKVSTPHIPTDSMLAIVLRSDTVHWFANMFKNASYQNFHVDCTELSVWKPLKGSMLSPKLWSHWRCSTNLGIRHASCLLDSK